MQLRQLTQLMQKSNKRNNNDMAMHTHTPLRLNFAGSGTIVQQSVLDQFTEVRNF